MIDNYMYTFFHTFGVTKNIDYLIEMKFKPIFTTKLFTNIRFRNDWHFYMIHISFGVAMNIDYFIEMKFQPIAIAKKVHLCELLTQHGNTAIYNWWWKLFLLKFARTEKGLLNSTEVKTQSNDL